MTIDVDSLPVEVHGQQFGSEWNGHYHRRMYHPLVASCAETGMRPWDPLWRLRHVGYPVSPRGYRGLPAFASLSMAGSD